ncbi:cobyric acid synthase [Cellulosilyticum sp. I15G10I2]|uniref:cobyric acid synthase n=1 Tax=Cellulosilyticum sp. I15G10I2 TaxID=1892843 RepID=UPI00085BFE81|nr:cobyric acid synthase [Cellulosilyticum sp. I15G10I2]
MGKPIMFQGTASNAGKSFIVAAFCRIFYQDGLKVIPFKSQNMALNSYITDEGLEMGRAQVFQAEAAGIQPNVKMNPVLLKPHADKHCQVVINGKVYGNMSAVEYHEFKPQLAEMIKEVYETISHDNDVVVIEGAGSPAEINLRDKDIVNMGMAELADSPVILIGDIDKGGVFAALAGTIMLLSEEEKKRVKGVIINKFRGDIKILEPGIKMLEDIIKIPVLGVIPYMHVNIEDEDSLTTRFNHQNHKQKDIEIEVVCLPHISNFTDLNIFETQEDVSIKYITRGKSIGNPDILIIPGSKNTIEDLLYLKESGLARQITALSQKGKLIFGICGGYQILGKKLCDPSGIECGINEIEGLGLLDIETVFEAEKVTTQVEGTVNKDLPGYLQNLAGKKVSGYEIHMGISTLGNGVKPILTIKEKLGKKVQLLEGCMNQEGNVMGTYLHGIFDELDFTRSLLNYIRTQKGLESKVSEVTSFKAFKDKEYDKIAQIVRENVDMEAIYKMIRG